MSCLAWITAHFHELFSLKLWHPVCSPCLHKPPKICRPHPLVTQPIYLALCAHYCCCVTQLILACWWVHSTACVAVHTTLDTSFFVKSKPCVRQSFFVCWGVFFVLHLRRSNKATPCWWWYLYNMLVAMNETVLSLRVGTWSWCLCVLFAVIRGMVSTLYCPFAMSPGQQVER